VCIHPLGTKPPSVSSCLSNAGKIILITLNNIKASHEDISVHSTLTRARTTSLIIGSETASRRACTVEKGGGQTAKQLPKTSSEDLFAHFTTLTCARTTSLIIASGTASRGAHTVEKGGERTARTRKSTRSSCQRHRARTSLQTLRPRVPTPPVSSLDSRQVSRQARTVEKAASRSRRGGSWRETVTKDTRRRHLRRLCAHVATLPVSSIITPPRAKGRRANRDEAEIRRGTGALNIERGDHKLYARGGNTISLISQHFTVSQLKEKLILPKGRRANRDDAEA